jgi:AraC-like DNA-binding protein
MPPPSPFAPFPPPPPWAARFRSDDLDEVRARVARMDGEHSRVAHRAGRLGFELARLGGSRILLGWGHVALETTIRGALSNPVVHVSAPAGSTYRFGRNVHVTDRATALFVAGGWEFSRCSPPGAALALAPSEEALLEEIRARCPDRRGQLVLTTRPFTLAPPAHARLVAAVADVVRSSAPDGQPLQAQLGEARLIAAIADVLLDNAAVIRTQQAATARIADLEGWIEAHLHHPITAGRLCHVAGVGQRALEKIFESRRGMSPMRFVTEGRLAAAHRTLVRGDPRVDVTRVALGLGFGHVGRFAALYRQAFGETPSESLKRARRTEGATA